MTLTCIYSLISSTVSNLGNNITSECDYSYVGYYELISAKNSATQLVNGRAKRMKDKGFTDPPNSSYLAVVIQHIQLCRAANRR